ncbi:hypothetical protein EAE89_21595 [Photorhabdus heterorhabditis]|nr:hypothetical protein [Photorhabdus heterorhabditis]
MVSMKKEEKLKNGLIRQYFLKRTGFNEVSAKEINIAVNRSNNYSRKIQNGKTPDELFKRIRIYLLPD